ncbi:MAG TPA: hypothetical protein P5206_07120, partial [Paludibacteraceae bacterium]|nr:hypothetical protein [Paludibacteraceae bacterium]
DGYHVSVRDKIPVYQDIWAKQGFVFNTTNDIIEAIYQNRLPYRLMITTHPQRWTDKLFAWFLELVMQSTKNTIKKWLITLRG